MTINNKETKIRETVESLGWFPWLVDAENDLVIARRENAQFTDRKYSTHRVLTAEFGPTGDVELNQYQIISGVYDLTMVEAMDDLIQRRAK